MQPTTERRTPIAYPFRTAVLRGLGVVLPPLITVVIFLWIGGTVNIYVLRPVNAGARNLLVRAIADIRHPDELPPESRSKVNPVLSDGMILQRLDSGNYVPKYVYDKVAARAIDGRVPSNSFDVYAQYVELTYLRPYLVVPTTLCLFILALYLLGKFLAAGIGRIFLNLFEGAIVRIPLVRNVYSAVKQVSDFLLTERQVTNSRVVAIEYPRKGMWQIAMVTGEGMEHLEEAAGEPVLSVFVPCSPMPMTGFTAAVRKSETIELDLTMDQAIQFIVSCGVVIPRSHLDKVRAVPSVESQPLPTPDPCPPASPQ